MELIDVVMKLNGPIRPVGETHTDTERMKNLLSLCDLTEGLLERISEVAEERNSHMASVKAAGALAFEFLVKYVEGSGDVMKGESTDGVRAVDPAEVWALWKEIEEYAGHGLSMDQITRFEAMLAAHGVEGKTNG